MKADEVLDRFRQTGALLEGHFLLSSGLHSPLYLQCALVLQHPTDAAELGSEIVRRLENRGIDTVASPAIGGLIIGYEVARALGARFIWTERENGIMTVRRGFHVKPGEKILVVEDVVTTGGATRETIEALRNAGAEVVGAASIVDRSAGRADVGVPRISLVELDVPAVDPELCSQCARGEEIVKPGSRKAVT
jgi:orotate phosphoribosyltransferase